MTTMLEKAAMKICQRASGEYLTAEQIWSTRAPWEKKEALETARAVLLAIREPDDLIESTIRRTGREDSDGYIENPDDVWTAAIDAILNGDA